MNPLEESLGVANADKSIEFWSAIQKYASISYESKSNAPYMGKCESSPTGTLKHYHELVCASVR